jgi:demethylmenaquinone methyltransferase/2-methoxy-6-polyprenyl-1,4-benzoquinol methylase
LDAGLREMARALKAGGRAVILEFAEPRGGWFGPLYLFYFRKVLPRVARAISGRPRAYEYLPATVSVFPDPEGVCRRLEEAGLTAVAARPLAAGAVMLYVAESRRCAPARA